MAKRFCYNELLPFVAMVSIECSDMGLFTLFKAATSKGMSNPVFVTYAYAVASLVLLPAPFISARSTVLPPLNFSIISKFGLLAVIGCSSQLFGYSGISFSSPALASSISNLVPAFTFLLAVIFRMEKLDARSKSCQANVMGSIVSISGAFVITFYQGPPITNADTHTSSFSLRQPLNILSSVDQNWAIGAILLTADYMLAPLWYIVQVQILKVYPAELTTVFFYNLCATIVAAVVGLLTETNVGAWKLEPDMALVSVVCSGIFGKCMSNVVYAWTLHLKGPVYVAMFKPLSIVIATAMGVVFLGDALYFGSLVGATIISIGFYTVMWGKATEEMDNEVVGSLESPITENAPLLQRYKTEIAEKKMHERRV